MRIVLFIGLVILGIALFTAKKLINDETLQRLANAFAVVALLAAALVFVVPAPTTISQPTETVLAHTPIPSISQLPSAAMPQTEMATPEDNYINGTKEGTLLGTESTEIFPELTFTPTEIPTDTLTPTATYTPTHTNTPNPTPTTTPKEYYLQGEGYELAEGVYMWMNPKFPLNNSSGCWGSPNKVEINIKNDSSNQFTVIFERHQFEVWDNTGKTYPVVASGIFYCPTSPGIEKKILERRNTASLFIMFEGEWPLDIKYFLVKVKNLSGHEVVFRKDI
jgi:hypothetical protein